MFPCLPPFSPIFPQACCSLHPPPKADTKWFFGLGFWRNAAPVFPQNIREFSNQYPFPPIFPTWGSFGGITRSFPAAGNEGPCIWHVVWGVLQAVGVARVALRCAYM